MTIKTIAAALAAVVACSAGAASAQDMARECAIQAGLAQAVADARINGTGQRKAQRVLTKGLSEEAQKYADFMPMLVAYIYEQVPAELVDDKVGAAWEAQCLEAAK
jgi:hypothetical protein